MLTDASIFYLAILGVMIVVSIVMPFFSEDKSNIWSPITIIGLVLIYYVVWPSLDGLSLFGAENVGNQSLFYITAVIFFGSVLLAFYWKRDTRYIKWNSYFTLDNSPKIAFILLIVALACYVPFRGFRTSISADTATITSARTGFVSYFIDLIAILAGATCLGFVGLKSKDTSTTKKYAIFVVVLYMTLTLYIVGGFRYRIVILLLSLATIYHLFPKPKRINYILVIPIAIITYLGFAIMDQARSYGRGIDMDAANNVSMDEASKGARENMDVCCFSIVVTNEYYRSEKFAGIEPVVTALMMPIPRALFPSKPDGSYMKEAQIRTLGNSDQGAAFLIFTEAYISFDVLGVIAYGLFVGWCCKIVWSNYRNNKESIGAILLLALFNGFCYTWISRGYMAAVFNDFVYFVVLPFVFARIINTFSKRTQHENICY